jgi:TatD DNase family protein
MIDTHCHLTDPGLSAQLEQVMARAAAAGVSRMVTIGTDPSDWQPCLDVCRRFANVRCALGVHPTYCNQAELKDLDVLRDLQRDPAVVAVGEMGLDYHYDNVPRPRQLEFFQGQLQLAVEAGRSVVIHSRQAIDDCLAVMKDFAVPAAVFHCFGGSAQEAAKIVDAGYLIGFTGVVTFKKTAELRQIAASAPAERILVETDAPYLSPEPKRGQKINEPALVIHTAQAVATARGMTLAEIDQITSANAMKFYGWP